MKNRLLAAVLLLYCGTAWGTTILPEPVSARPGEGSFQLDRTTAIAYSGESLKPLVAYLSEYLPGVPILEAPAGPMQTLGIRNYIGLELRPDATIPEEGYLLSVAPDRIEILGRDYGGVFNGVQTLLQLLPPEIYRKQGIESCRIDAVEIEDYPRFPYRGMMLDVVRTFLPKEEVLRFIDRMAIHKLNKLHFHLADDEGWRIEILSHPELTEKGAFRGPDRIVKPSYGCYEEDYGGFYTQEELREIVAYARVRNIEIIPEIDLPGHSRAAGAILPILCNYTPDLTASDGYDMRNVWCVSKESNYALLDDILGEIADLFPAPYLHIGGDEVSTRQWLSCPDCRATMAREGFTKGTQLQRHFMTRTTEIVRRHGKLPAVWNEAIAEGGIPEARVHGWKDVKACREAAGKGYRTIVMPGQYFYFDMKQSASEPGMTWAGTGDALKTYAFEPSEIFTAEEIGCIEGVEGAYWSECLLSNGTEFLYYQTYPRICALAEMGWSPAEKRSLEKFRNKLDSVHFSRLQALGIRYRPFPKGDASSDSSPLRRPAVRFTSSLEASPRNPYSNVENYSHYARTRTTCKQGDWFLFVFDAPLASERIEIITGYDYMPRVLCIGHVELSYDGTHFEQAGKLTDGRAVLTPAKPIRAIRIVSDRDGNFDSSVIIQPLRIH